MLVACDLPGGWPQPPRVGFPLTNTDRQRIGDWRLQMRSKQPLAQFWDCYEGICVRIPDAKGEFLEELELRCCYSCEPVWED